MLQQLDSIFYDDDDLPNFEIKLYPETTEEPGPNEEELEENQDSSQEIDNFIQNEKSLNIVKKTQVDWRKFESFSNEKTDGRFNITTIPCQELDKLLCHFFQDVSGVLHIIGFKMESVISSQKRSKRYQLIYILFKMADRQETD